MPCPRILHALVLSQEPTVPSSMIMPAQHSQPFMRNAFPPQLWYDIERIPMQLCFEMMTKLRLLYPLWHQVMPAYFAIFAESAPASELGVITCEYVHA